MGTKKGNKRQQSYSDYQRESGTLTGMDAPAGGDARGTGCAAQRRAALLHLHPKHRPQATGIEKVHLPVQHRL